MSTLGALVQKASHKITIDRAVVFSIAGRLVSLCSGLVTTLLVAFYFSRELQGYYYTFSAVVAFQVFGELGLSGVLINFASHEWSKLRIDHRGCIVGDEHALSRLRSLARFALKWYAIAATAVTLVLVVGGWIFFSASTEFAVSWRAPWVTLCLVTGLTLLAVPVWALLEGCNQVSSVYAFRLIQIAVSGAAVWASIYLGAGLWVSSIGGSVGFLTTALLVSRRFGHFLSTVFLRETMGPRLNWRVDILPMQWRIALSWISGYFSYSLFAPVLFYYHGPVVAGQMGMTWSVVSILTALTYAWITPRAPIFGMLIANKRYVELDQLFFRISTVVLAVTIVCALAIWFLVFILDQLGHSFATRLLSPASTACLLVGTIIMCATIPMATYLRAHKSEPLLAPSVAGGVLTTVAVVVLGKHFSAEGVAIGFLGVTAIVAPFVILIWRRKRSQWHASQQFENVKA